MTMLDDDILSTLFTQAAEALTPPASGAADILAKAFGPADAPSDAAPDGEPEPDATRPRADELAAARARRLARTLGAHRVLTVAACVVLALALAGGVTWLGGGPAPKAGNVALGAHAGAKSAASLPGAVPTTTIPNTFATGGSGTVGAATGAGATTGAANAAPSEPLSAAPVPSSSTSTGASPNSASVLSNVGQPARIEQTGSLSLTVPKGSLSRTMTQLNFLAGAYNGFVSNSTTQSGPVAENGAPSGSITLEVPVASFSDVLKKAQALGKTVSLTTKATDVTAQYVDLQSRIAALQASRQQYLTIMAKATSIGDVLAVQAQLDTIDSQIQQLQGQLNVLSSETDYSSLTVTATEGIPVVHHHPVPRPHRSGLATAWSNSVHGFVDGVEGLIRLAGPALFILLCGAVVLVGGRLGWRRYQRHRL